MPYRSIKPTSVIFLSLFISGVAWAQPATQPAPGGPGCDDDYIKAPIKAQYDATFPKTDDGRPNEPDQCKASKKARMQNAQFQQDNPEGKFGAGCGSNPSNCKPEVTDDMVDMVDKTMDAVSQCLKNNNKFGGVTNPTPCPDMPSCKMDKLIGHESQFIPNVYSATNAGGLGQLTGIAIDQVNTNFDATIAALKNCGAIKNKFKKLDSDVAKKCERTDPANIVSNMLYTALMMNYNTNEVNKATRKNGQGLSCGGMQDLAIWAHNTGLNNMQTAIDAVLAANPGKTLAQLEAAGTLNQLLANEMPDNEKKNYLDNVKAVDLPGCCT